MEIPLKATQALINYMAFRSFKSVESKEVCTALNVLTAVRALGGIALGVAMARYNLDPTAVAASASALAVTDAEGSLIVATKRWPRFQRMLRIIPSSIGRIIDPIADKIYVMSIFAGGLINHSIPFWHGAGILATEAATTAVTGLATMQDKEPEVTNTGKVGMLGRCGTIGFDLAAAAVEPGSTHDALVYAGHVSAGTAIVLGGMSCYQIWRQSQAEPLSEPLV